VSAKVTSWAEGYYNSEEIRNVVQFTQRSRYDCTTDLECNHVDSRFFPSSRAKGIHGNIRALEAVLADVKTRGADAIVNLGDCVTSPLWPRETYDLLESLSLSTVRGNHDRSLAEYRVDDLPRAGKFTHEALTGQQRETLGNLPTRIEVAPGILAVHGTPDDDSIFLLEEIYNERLIPAAREVVLARLGPHARGHTGLRAPALPA
jgi:3',5'-cyclic AMP phosphodiesterase CpdA